MRTHIKIVYGICLTIAFITLVISIQITDIITGAKMGVDISAFTLYSAAMVRLATAKVLENKKKK